MRNCFVFLSLALLAISCKKNDATTTLGSLPGCDLLTQKNPRFQDITITYDNLGRISTVMYIYPGLNMPVINTASYNSLNQLIKYGSSNTGQFYNLYFYNTTGALTSMIRYTYNSDSSKYSPMQWVAYTYGVNSITALLYDAHHVKPSSHWVASLDNNGNIVNNTVYDSGGNVLSTEISEYDNMKNPYAGDKYIMFNLFQAKRANNSTKITSHDTASGTLINSYSYKYNADGYPDYYVSNNDTTKFGYKCH